MKVKTNVLFNGPHLEEELEEWLNEPHEGHLVNVILTERPDEPQRVIVRAIFDTSDYDEANADLEAEMKHANEEVGALVSIILATHKAANEMALTDYAKLELVKTVLARCVSMRDSATVVDMGKLLPPRG